jgi:hypothetical protein
MSRPQFTVKDAIIIQDAQLADWRKVLKPSVHARLCELVRATNEGVTSGYEIVRGSRIDEILWNNIAKNI